MPRKPNLRGPKSKKSKDEEPKPMPLVRKIKDEYFIDTKERALIKITQIPIQTKCYKVNILSPNVIIFCKLTTRSRPF